MCKHYGYLIKDERLVCSQCGEPSTKAELKDNKIVPIKAGGQPENKMADKPEDKGVNWPSESKRQTKVRRKR